MAKVLGQAPLGPEQLQTMVSNLGLEIVNIAPVILKTQNVAHLGHLYQGTQETLWLGAAGWFSSI